MGSRAAAVVGLMVGLWGGWGCGPPEPGQVIGSGRQPIINGSPCLSREAPTAVALIWEATIETHSVELPIRTLICTGTLIAPDTVMTAAHCVALSEMLGDVMTFKDEKYYVSFQEDLRYLLMDVSDGGFGALPRLPTDAVAARAWVAHPQFKEAYQHWEKGLGNYYDVGLVFLEWQVSRIRPAALITQDEARQIKTGVEVLISGWGQTLADSYDPLNPTKDLQAGKKICGNSKINEVGDHELQIGSDKTTTRKCHGDSGGPSYMSVQADTNEKQRVIGITSHAYDETDCGKGGVDTRVDAFRDWIDKQMKDACSTRKRAWCEVTGIPAPDHPYPISSGGGCAVHGRRPPSGLWPLLLALLLALYRRAP